MSARLQKKLPRMLLHFRKWPAQPFLGLYRLLGSSQGSPGDRPPCSLWEEHLLCAVSISIAGHAAGVSAPSQCWCLCLGTGGVRRWRGLGFACGLFGGVDTCHKQCDFGRSVCFFAGGGIPATPGQGVCGTAVSTS